MFKNSRTIYESVDRSKKPYHIIIEPIMEKEEVHINIDYQKEEFLSAVDRGETHLVRDLLNQGVDVTTNSNYAIGQAVNNADKDMIRVLIETRGKDLKNKDASLTLFAASMVDKPLLKDTIKRLAYSPHEIIYGMGFAGNFNLTLISAITKATPDESLKKILKALKLEGMIKPDKPIFVEVEKEALKRASKSLAIKLSNKNSPHIEF
jgi:hypothetical protein